MSEVCKIDGCCKPKKYRGWCNAHYQRWLRHGSPDGGRKFSRGEPLRWLQAHLHYSTDECLIWPFGRNAGGYGVLCGAEKDRQLAHRWACEQVHGPAPSPEHHAAHSCGNGQNGCVAPNHLRWATPTENVADAREHGTLAALHYQGERHPQAKLTAQDVREIRRRLAAGEVAAELANTFGVSRANIYSIKGGYTWPEVAAA